MGGVLGILFKRFLKERYQDTIIKATGFHGVVHGQGLYILLYPGNDTVRQHDRPCRGALRLYDGCRVE